MAFPMKHNQCYDDNKIGKKIKCGSLGSYAAIAAVKDRLGTEPGENMNIQNLADEMMMVMIVMMMVIKTMMMVIKTMMMVLVMISMSMKSRSM